MFTYESLKDCRPTGQETMKEVIQKVHQLAREHASLPFTPCLEGDYVLWDFRVSFLLLRLLFYSPRYSHRVPIKMERKTEPHTTGRPSIMLIW